MTRILSFIVALFKKLFGREDKTVTHAESVQKATEEVTATMAGDEEDEEEGEKVGVYHYTFPHGDRIDNGFPWRGSEEREKITRIVTTDETNELEPFAFEKCINAETAVIGEKVTVISRHCFEDCFKLRKVTFKGKIKRIGDDAFYNCLSLETIEADLSELEEIGSRVFHNCRELAVIDLSKCGKLQKVHEEAFAGCNATIKM